MRNTTVYIWQSSFHMKLIDQGVIITQKVQATQWLQKTHRYIPTSNETQQHETTAILTKLKLSCLHQGACDLV